MVTIQNCNHTKSQWHSKNHDMRAWLCWGVNKAKLWILWRKWGNTQKWVTWAHIILKWLTSYLTWVINEPFFDRLVLCITGCPAIQSDICYLVKFCDSYFWYLPFLVFMNVYIVCWLEELLKFLMLHDKFAFTPTRFWQRFAETNNKLQSANGK